LEMGTKKLRNKSLSKDLSGQFACQFQADALPRPANAIFAN
jgi:hypothetical protein